MKPYFNNIQILPIRYHFSVQSLNQIYNDANFAWHQMD